MAAGVNPNARDLHGITPLHEAARIGLPDAISALIVGGANTDAQDEKGRTPLHIAVENDRMPAPLVAPLLDAGADSKVRDNDGKTPWDHAKDNHALKGKEEYWLLNDARFEREQPEEDSGGAFSR